MYTTFFWAFWNLKIHFPATTCFIQPVHQFHSLLQGLTRKERRIWGPLWPIRNANGGGRCPQWTQMEFFTCKRREQRLAFTLKLIHKNNIFNKNTLRHDFDL
ncbi:hypothetical protein AABB24_007742 [Solanum stoloniferum]|uniref:Secreted protein n=1 Tax=Solanum stoloniferum TaxID=62892 RepID=A0ABD2UQZ8_9SOLN